MPTAKCFLMTSNGKDGWGSPTLQAFSAVESFRAALAMWKLHLCLKWSKRCRGQASVAFTRCHRNLSRSVPLHVTAIKLFMPCFWAPTGGAAAVGASTRILQGKSLLSDTESLWDAEGAARRFMCGQHTFKQQAQHKGTFRPWRLEKPRGQF